MRTIATTARTAIAAIRTRSQPPDFSSGIGADSLIQSSLLALEPGSQRAQSERPQAMPAAWRRHVGTQAHLEGSISPRAKPTQRGRHGAAFGQQGFCLDGHDKTAGESVQPVRLCDSLRDLVNLATLAADSACIINPVVFAPPLWRSADVRRTIRCRHSSR
jgi:hypothetical protein